MAFEMAQQLRKQGEEVALLVLLDPPGPGYSFTAPSRPLPRTARLGEWAHRQWRNLAPLEPRKQIAYLWDRVAGWTKVPLTRVSDAAKKAACRVYIATGANYPIPHSLRTLYINAVHSQARRGYMPQVYPGDVVVLRTVERSGDLEPVWRSLVAGKLEIQQAPGRHEEIVFNQDHVRGLAKQLKACLDRAQSPSVHVQASFERAHVLAYDSPAESVRSL